MPRSGRKSDSARLACWARVARRLQCPELHDGVSDVRRFPRGGGCAILTGWQARAGACTGWVWDR
eukprot:10150687-Alexandrium_andersonii.AAC.1